MTTRMPKHDSTDQEPTQSARTAERSLLRTLLPGRPGMTTGDVVSSRLLVKVGMALILVLSAVVAGTGGAAAAQIEPGDRSDQWPDERPLTESDDTQSDDIQSEIVETNEEYITLEVRFPQDIFAGEEQFPQDIFAGEEQFPQDIFAGEEGVNVTCPECGSVHDGPADTGYQIDDGPVLDRPQADIVDSNGESTVIEAQLPRDIFADKSSISTLEIPVDQLSEDRAGGLDLTQEQIPGPKWDDSSETTTRAAVNEMAGPLFISEEQVATTEGTGATYHPKRDDSSETVSGAAVIQFSGTRPPVEASVVVVIPGTNWDDGEEIAHNPATLSTSPLPEVTTSSTPGINTGYIVITSGSNLDDGDNSVPGDSQSNSGDISVPGDSQSNSGDISVPSAGGLNGF